MRSSWHSLLLFVCHGLIAPSASVLLSSGITSRQSIPIVRPNPRQCSHAPSGELNEKLLGTTSPYAMSQCAQGRCAEYLKPPASAAAAERPSRDRVRTGMCALEPEGP